MGKKSRNPVLRTPGAKEQRFQPSTSMDPGFRLYGSSPQTPWIQASSVFNLHGFRLQPPWIQNSDSMDQGFRLSGSRLQIPWIQTLDSMDPNFSLQTPISLPS